MDNLSLKMSILTGAPLPSDPILLSDHSSNSPQPAPAQQSVSLSEWLDMADSMRLQFHKQQSDRSDNANELQRVRQERTTLKHRLRQSSKAIRDKDALIADCRCENIRFKERALAAEQDSKTAQRLLAAQVKECDQLDDQNEQYRMRLELAKGESDLVDTMSMDELNELEKQLNKGLERLQDARMRIVSEDRQCVVCQDRSKAVCFVDGCDHLVLCAQCEHALVPKACPLCNQGYSQVKVLNI